jgi:hypothetical protein
MSDKRKKNSNMHFYARTANKLHRFNSKTKRNAWVCESPDTRSTVVLSSIPRIDLANDKVYEPFRVRKEIQMWQQLESHEVYVGIRPEEEEPTMEVTKEDIREFVYEVLDEIERPAKHEELDVELTILANRIMLSVGDLTEIGEECGDKMTRLAINMACKSLVATHEDIMRKARGE